MRVESPNLYWDFSPIENSTLLSYVSYCKDKSGEYVLSRSWEC
jgi:hypothetical protein